MGSYAVLARGEVWAEVEEQLSAAAPLSGAEKRYSGRIRRELEVNVLGRSFKISPKLFQPFTYYDKIESNWELSLSERLTLPFVLTARTWREYLLEEGAPDRQSVQTWLQRALTERAEKCLLRRGVQKSTTARSP